MSYTEYPFSLPKGFVDGEGNFHRQGKMRPATGKDEIAIHDYLKGNNSEDEGMFLILSRVITSLGSLTKITPEMFEQLFLIDFAYLKEFYLRINTQEGDFPDLGDTFSYPLDELYQEVTFIALHFHWSLEDILKMEHQERRRWVKEIGRLVQQG
ncbi:MAG: phage tail assembly protein [Okeania sp. SIO2D1]|nr:phage tail assembly protein [Okeania sp. SIO2D1]